MARMDERRLREETQRQLAALEASRSQLHAEARGAANSQVPPPRRHSSKAPPHPKPQQRQRTTAARQHLHHRHTEPRPAPPCACA
eukprot:scaffold83733_cov59-Phaeocystis_antarctica.AAC.8